MTAPVSDPRAALAALLEQLGVRRVNMEPTTGRFGQILSREAFAELLAARGVGVESRCLASTTPPGHGLCDLPRGHIGGHEFNGALPGRAAGADVFQQLAALRAQLAAAHEALRRAETAIVASATAHHEGDPQEAYHQLYQYAEPTFTLPGDPFARLAARLLAARQEEQP